MNAPDLDNPLTSPFWIAASEDRLSLPHCESCERFVWYPQPHCANCGAGLSWKDVSGAATLAGFSIVERPLFPAFAKWAPYIVALVSIDEQPDVRLVSQLVDCNRQQLSCDMRLQVTFRELEVDGGVFYKAPLFEPAGV